MTGCTLLERMKNPKVTKRGPGDYLVEAYGKTYYVESCDRLISGWPKGWKLNGHGHNRWFESKKAAVAYLKWHTVPALY